LLGVGNGDPACHESDKANQRSAFNGLCLAIIRAGLTNGAIALKAEAAGLKSASATIEAH
jgi:beta-galactosidase